MVTTLHIPCLHKGDTSSHHGALNVLLILVHVHAHLYMHISSHIFSASILSHIPQTKLKSTVILHICLVYRLSIIIISYLFVIISCCHKSLYIFVYFSFQLISITSQLLSISIYTQTHPPLLIYTYTLFTYVYLPAHTALSLVITVYLYIYIFYLFLNLTGYL